MESFYEILLKRPVFIFFFFLYFFVVKKSGIYDLDCSTEEYCNKIFERRLHLWKDLFEPHWVDFENHLDDTVACMYTQVHHFSV